MKSLNIIIIKRGLVATCLSLMAVGCAESENKNGSGTSQSTPTDNVHTFSAPHVVGIYVGGALYSREDKSISGPINMQEGEKQTFYAIVYDPDISSGESIDVLINSSTTKLNTNVSDSLKGYVSLANEMASEHLPQALEEYKNVNVYMVFNFTLGQELAIDGRVFGTHELVIRAIDGRQLQDAAGVFKIAIDIKNANDSPIISSIKYSGGVPQEDKKENTFVVAEGGANGVIRIKVDDPDIQHGDIIRLNVNPKGKSVAASSSAISKEFTSLRGRALSSTKSDKGYFSLKSNIAEPNQVEFIVNIASELMQDTDIGEYRFEFLVSDDIGKFSAQDIILIVEDSNDLTTIPSFSSSGNLTSITPAPNNGRPLFTIYEGQSGQINFTLFDEDLVHNPKPTLIYDITGDSVDAQIISWDIRTKPSSPDERILTVDIGSGLINPQQIDDAHVRTYELNLDVSTSGSGGEVAINYPFTLQIINVNDAPRIVNMTSFGSVRRSDKGNDRGNDMEHFIVAEGVSPNGGINVTVEDMDFIVGDRVSLTIASATLDDMFISRFISIAKAQIDESDADSNQQVTFTINISSELLDDAEVGNHTLKINATDDEGASTISNLVLIVENSDDLATISRFSTSGNMTSISPVPNNGRPLFTIYEGQSGQIEFTLFDEDLVHNPKPTLIYDITGDTVDAQIINLTLGTKPSSPDERILIVDIGSGVQQIDDEHVGTYELSLDISTSGSGGVVAINYPFTLQIIDVNNAPRIVNITSFGSVSRSNLEHFVVAEGASGNGGINITVEDMDSILLDRISLTVASDTLDDRFMSVTKAPIDESDADSNQQVIFTINISSELLDDAEVGNHTLKINATDDEGASTISNLILIVENSDDLTTIPSFSSSGNLTSITPVPNNGRPLFTIYEGQSGQIEFTLSDEDLTHNPTLIYDITGSPIDAQIISLAHKVKPSSPDDRILTVDIGGGLINPRQIDDEHVGTYELSLDVSTSGSGGEVSINYPFTLQIINVNDAPRIVDMTSSGSVSRIDRGKDMDHFIVAEGVSPNGGINVIVEDMDFILGDRVSLTVASATLDDMFIARFISVAKAHIDESEADSNQQVTFTINVSSETLDDTDLGTYILEINLTDAEGASITRQINLVVENTNEPPVFAQKTYDFTAFIQTAAPTLPAGTTIATIGTTGQQLCPPSSSISGCVSPIMPNIVASDPDAGDSANLIYSIVNPDTDKAKFYIEDFRIKNKLPLQFKAKESFNITVKDPHGKRAIEEALVTVTVRRPSNSDKDNDGDGIDDRYDGAPGDPTAKTMGSGTRADPYIIHNLFQLQAIAGVDHEGSGLLASSYTKNSYLYGDGLVKQLSSHYRLAYDINAFITTTVFWDNGKVRQPTGLNQKGFIPIGIGVCDGGTTQCDSSAALRQVDGNPVRFNGTFDGAGFEISRLGVDRPSSYVGLFGAVGDGGIIANLSLTSARITNSATRESTNDAVKFSHGGLLVGEMSGGTIDNVNVTGTINGVDNRYGVGNRYGGMAGTVASGRNPLVPGIIKNSMADVKITANGAIFGGLVGALGTNSFIHASNAKGNLIPIVSSSNIPLASEIGGLVGVSDGNIFASYASGNVSGYHYVGGLVGKVNQGNVIGSFAAGDLEGIRYVGGVFGSVLGGTHKYLYYAGLLPSYARGASDSIGGIVGQITAGSTIYSVINMRSSNSISKLKGGLIFGMINLVGGANSPDIHNAYSINLPNNFAGYILLNTYQSGLPPLSALGGKYETIKLLTENQLRDCGNDGIPADAIVMPAAGCTDLFPSAYWGETTESLLGSDFTVGWLLAPSELPVIQVSRLTGMGTLGDMITPVPAQQKCYIEPTYTHPTYCPTKR